MIYTVAIFADNNPELEAAFISVKPLEPLYQKLVLSGSQSWHNGTLDGTEPSQTKLVSPVLFLLWQVKMSPIEKVQVVNLLCLLSCTGSCRQSALRRENRRSQSRCSVYCFYLLLSFFFIPQKHASRCSFIEFLLPASVEVSCVWTHPENLRFVSISLSAV